MLIKLTLLMTLLLFAVINDVNEYRIKNKLNLLFIILGLVYNIFLDSGLNTIYSIVGIVFPLLMLLPLYALNMLGAGDIKLFCAIGSLIGLYGVMLSIAYSFLFGLAYALLIMIYRGNMIGRFMKLYGYFMNCLISMSIQPYYSLKEDNDGKMHFSIPIAMGTLAVNFLFLA
jgi:prepilin peptidase CpaA